MANKKPFSYAIFSALYAPHTGGVEAYTAGIANELARQGNRVSVITCKLNESAPAHETQENGVEIVRLPCRALMDARLPLLRKSAEFHRKMNELGTRNFDRIIINTRFYGLSLEGARFAAANNIPAVIVEHGSAHLSMGNALIDCAVQAYEHFATRRIRATHLPFCGVSAAASRWLEHFGITCMGIVPNALDANKYLASAAKRDFRQELGIASDTLLVAFVGRLVSEKGVRELLEAAQILAENAEGTATHLEAPCPKAARPEAPQTQTGRAEGAHPEATRPEKTCPEAPYPKAPQPTAARNVAFAFAGTGPLLPAVQKAQETLPVFALGRLDGPNVAALLRTSNVLCLPSRSEGFATVLLEAGACACMPITTNVGGASELGITENACETAGILLLDAHPQTIARAIEQARRNPAFCHERALHLAQSVQRNHTWKQTALAFEHLFTGIESTSSSWKAVRND